MLNREMETIKQNQVEILELNRAKHEKFTRQTQQQIWDPEKKKKNEFEERSIEGIQSNEQKYF